MNHSLSLRIGLVALALAVFAPAASAQVFQKSPGDTGSAPLSSSEVSDAEVESAAEILVALERQRTQLEKEYGEPEDMTETERRQVQIETMRKRQALMQRKSIEEDLDTGRLELIMVSARKDSTLHDRVHTAMDKKRKKKMKNDESQQKGQ